MLTALITAAAIATAPGLAVSQSGRLYVEGAQITRGAQPAWAPDGKSIAFQRFGELFTIDPKTKKEIRIVKREPSLHWPASGPAWSPDGRKLVFGGTFDVLTVDLATRKIVNLTHSQHSWQANFTPAWSPDGKTIAFARNTNANQSDIYTMRPNGKGLRRLTFTERVGTKTGDEMMPTWSPDGRTIVFVSNRDGNFELYAIDRDGRNERRITYTDPPDYDEENPRFSRDGKRILYTHDGRVAHMKADGSDVRELGLGNAADWR